MAEYSEQQLETHLMELENQGMADRRSELVGPRWLSLLHDDENDRAYVLRHGVDETEGLSVPPDTEVWQYATFDEAERAYLQLLAEAREAGELIDEDSDEGIGDYETAGAELRDVYSAEEDDPLIANLPDDEEGRPASEE
jgi:hypothetical protein